MSSIIANLSLSCLIESNFTYLISRIMNSYNYRNSFRIELCFNSNIILTNYLNFTVYFGVFGWSSNNYFKLLNLDVKMVWIIFSSLSPGLPGNKNPPSNYIFFFFDFGLLDCTSSSSDEGLKVLTNCVSYEMRVVLCSDQNYSIGTC